MAYFAYMCAAPARRSELNTEVSGTLIRNFCEVNAWQLAGTFIDDPSAADVPWFDRPAGRRLAARLAPGHEVIVPGLYDIHTSNREMLAIVQDLRRRRVIIHIINAPGLLGHADAPLSTSGLMGEIIETALSVLVSLQRTRRSEAVALGMLRRKATDRKYCRYAGYGFRWEGRKGRERRVPDAREQGIIKTILAWRQDGFSYYKIAARLLYKRVRTANGNEWSPARVRRVCLMERYVASSD